MADVDGADGVADAAGVAEADGCNSGSNSGSSSGSDSGSDSGPEEDGGSSREAAAKAKAKAAPSKAVEKFEPSLSMTLEEHVASHDYPKNIATCGACKFWKKQGELERLSVCDESSHPEA